MTDDIQMHNERPAGGSSKPHVSSSTVFNEDCMTVMARYPDKFFDLAVVDVPYGIGASDWDDNDSMFRATDKWKGCKKSGYAIKGWDKEPPPKEYFDLLFSKSKNQIIWGANHFISRMPFDSPAWLVWDKKTSGNFSDCELAWCSIGGSVKKFEWLWNGFQKQRPEERIHPTQKPIALYDWIFTKFAEKGQNVLDTHLGSGSCRIAAHKHNLEFVGCEIDKDYFEAEEARFKEFTSQLRLFG